MESETCDLFFSGPDSCSFENIKINIEDEKVAFDEKILKTLKIIHHDIKQTLHITKNTSMLDGDRGYISFADINFDNIPDLAITTSFGLANLYLDYWVFDNSKKKYVYLGNFTRFKLNTENKTLSNVVKLNAANYENSTFKWQGLKLIKR